MKNVQCLIAVGIVPEICHNLWLTRERNIWSRSLNISNRTVTWVPNLPQPTSVLSVQRNACEISSDIEPLNSLGSGKYFKSTKRLLVLSYTTCSCKFLSVCWKALCAESAKNWSEKHEFNKWLVRYVEGHSNKQSTMPSVAFYGNFWIRCSRDEICSTMSSFIVRFWIYYLVFWTAKAIEAWVPISY